jgi:hypothetical protein
MLLSMGINTVSNAKVQGRHVLADVIANPEHVSAEKFPGTVRHAASTSHETLHRPFYSEAVTPFQHLHRVARAFLTPMKIEGDDIGCCQAGRFNYRCEDNG